MQIIDELVEYFAELLTEKQSNAVAQLFGLPKRPDRNDPDEPYMPDRDDEDDEDDEYSRYDEYEFPAKTRHGHSGGKRRRWRHPAITAEGLVAIFRKTARAQWDKNPFDRDFIISLAEAHDADHFAGHRTTNRWKRFILAVESLKDLDEDALWEAVRMLWEKSGPSIFRDWFHAIRDGSFEALLNDFCRSRVEGVAGRAALAALREITYPEDAPRLRNANLFRPLLENGELAAIFDYCRLLRKLEYIFFRTVEESQRTMRR